MKMISCRMIIERYILSRYLSCSISIRRENVSGRYITSVSSGAVKTAVPSWRSEELSAPGALSLIFPLSNSPHTVLGNNHVDSHVVPATRQPEQNKLRWDKPSLHSPELCKKTVVIPFAVSYSVAVRVKCKRGHDAYSMCVDVLDEKLCARRRSRYVIVAGYQLVGGCSHSKNSLCGLPGFVTGYAMRLPSSIALRATTLTSSSPFTGE